jgi:tagatose 6-phosphate kinase
MDASASEIIVLNLNPAIQNTLIFDRLIPGEVNRAREHYIDASGKGTNVARVLVQLGRKVQLVGHAGGRDRGLFLELCEKDHIDFRLFESDSELRRCHSLVSRDGSPVTELVEESDPIARPELPGRIRAEFEHLAATACALVISGTRAPGYPDSLLPDMVALARKQGLFVLLDIKGADLKACLPARPNLIKPNLSEFAASFLPGTDSATIDSVKVQAAMAAINRDFGCDVVITQGGGDILAYKNDKLIVKPVTPLRAINATGSGDAFAAGLLLALLNKIPFSDALTEAQRCGGLNALQVRPGRIL